MKKYNRSEIFKKAWQLVKAFGMTISEGLKKAWKEAKTMSKRDEMIAKLEALVAENNSHDNGYHYKAIVSDWENYGKNRTYLSYVETRDHSKHNVIKKFGYVDNATNEYVPEKYGKLA